MLRKAGQMFPLPGIEPQISARPTRSLVDIPTELSSVQGCLQRSQKPQHKSSIDVTTGDESGRILNERCGSIIEPHRAICIRGTEKRRDNIRQDIERPNLG
jgi:hypothetical protein